MKGKLKTPGEQGVNMAGAGGYFSPRRDRFSNRNETHGDLKRIFPVNVAIFKTSSIPWDTASPSLPPALGRLISPCPFLSEDEYWTQD
jgi:hypothetical protein